MSAPLWLPGVTRLPPPASQGTIPRGLQGRGRRLFTWHTFEAPYSYSPDGRAAMRYLHSRGSTSHFVLHPTTGALIQALPANVGARTLRANAPGQHTNAYGDVHMQVEVIAYARRPFTLDLTPAGRASLQRLMDFLRSWGIPDQWAWADMVRPPATYAEANRHGSRGQPSRSGHATHSRWWANDHWDPGAIEKPWVIAPPPRPVTPGRDGGVFFEGATGTDIRTWQTSLVDVGHDLDPDGIFGPLTTAATRAFQADHGITVDGRVGPETRTTMEDTMSKIDAVLAETRAIRADLKRTDAKVDTQHQVTTRTLASISDAVAKIPGAVWAHRLYGFVAHYWLRRGAIADPGHRHFPADPGSPAHKELLAEVAQRGYATIYAPDGETRLRLTDEGNFEIEED